MSEFLRRTEAAETLEENKRAKHSKPKGNYGCEIMWHPAFAAECVALLSSMPLPEIAAWLCEHLADTMNESCALDFYDYGYVADVLREGLADSPTPLAALRLTRALAWVEQAGTALLAGQAALSPVVAATDAPTMTASAA